VFGFLLLKGEGDGAGIGLLEEKRDERREEEEKKGGRVSASFARSKREKGVGGRMIDRRTEEGP